MTGAATSGTFALVDAHVHVYPEFSAGRLLSAAWDNFAQAARRLHANPWQGYLLLTETARDHWFDSVARTPGTLPGGEGWSLQPVEGSEISLVASRGDARLLVVAGRQIVTAERIELHALGTRARFEDGRPAEAALEAIRQAHALAAVPWGVGKWIGARGSLVRQLLSGRQSGSVLLAADNGGRPGLWREPLLDLGERAVLRGSDPLPLRGEERRAGESGVVLRFDERQAPSVRALMDELERRPRADVRPFGNDERLSRFLRNQVALRMRRPTNV